MRKFTFTYETLRQSKVVTEKQIKKEIAKHNHRMNQLNLVNEHLGRELERLIQQRCYRLNLGSSAIMLLQFENSYHNITEQKKDILAEIEKLEQTIKVCEGKLLQLMKEIKALDKIEQQQYEEYSKDLKSDQDKEADEIIGFRTSRQLQGAMA